MIALVQSIIEYTQRWHRKLPGDGTQDGYIEGRKRPKWPSLKGQDNADQNVNSNMFYWYFVKSALFKLIAARLCTIFPSSPPFILPGGFLLKPNCMPLRHSLNHLLKKNFQIVLLRYIFFPSFCICNVLVSIYWNLSCIRSAMSCQNMLLNIATEWRSCQAAERNGRKFSSSMQKASNSGKSYHTMSRREQKKTSGSSSLKV